MRILIADDSSVIRGLLHRNLHGKENINVVDTASNGQMAIEMAKKHQPDVILLGIYMPIMDGSKAIPEILKVAPQTKIILISGPSQKDAKIVIDSLAQGAVDFVEKSENNTAFFNEILSKTLLMAQSSGRDISIKAKENASSLLQTPSTLTASTSKSGTFTQKINAIAIASSTGGPRALLTLFKIISGCKLRVPIFITQHMNPTFIPLFGQQLQQQSGLICKEVKDNDIIESNRIYLAPGDHHMRVKNEASHQYISLSKDPHVNSCRPSADPMFFSIADVYGPHVLAIVLTGMGQDGAMGAKMISKQGGIVIAQDAGSSVVYGMPKAVADLGICEAILPPNEIADYMIKVSKNG